MYLEPNWPPFFKVGALQNKAQIPIKTRGPIWVLGEIYIYTSPMDPMGKSSTAKNPRHHDYDPLAVASVVANRALAKKNTSTSSFYGVPPPRKPYGFHVCYIYLHLVVLFFW